MKKVLWKGPAPGAELVKAAAAAGLELAMAGEADAVVVCTPSGKSAPAGVGTDRPWLWVAKEKISPAQVVAAVERGAYDAVELTGKGGAARLWGRLNEVLTPEPLPDAASHLVANSAAAQRLLRQLASAARTNQPVLLTGETGTGKELAARLVHGWSGRKKGPFVPINCAAIPNELMEGELFGYVKGAFSGAVRDYPGQLEAGADGTVFLDEIDDTPLPLQNKLLRVLEDRVVSRLGENAWRKVNFRVVAATNRDLMVLIANGQFGDDFYARLAIVNITLPPLRERREDLPALVEHLIARFYAEEPAAKARAWVRHVSPAAAAAMAAHAWPGNIRELRNVVFAALVQKRAGDELLLSDLPRALLRQAGAQVEAGVADPRRVADAIAAGGFNLKAAVESLERVALVSALAKAQGNAALAAGLLGEVGRGAARDPGGTVRAMMRRLGVERT
jgi:transcriptional regulator with PAS, ATPase and Fis domain